MGKKNRGSILIILVVAILLAASIFFAARFLLGDYNLLSLPGARAKDAFAKDAVLKAVKFTNSKGEKKEFVIVQSSEAGGVPIADAYIADPTLSKSTSIKIPSLSGDSNLAYASSPIYIGAASLTVSASPEKDKKLILVAITVGDATTIKILDDEGNVVNENSVNSLLLKFQNKCKCNFVFDGWNGNNKFYVKVSTFAGELYRAELEGLSGEISGDVKKVS